MIKFSWDKLISLCDYNDIKMYRVLQYSCGIYVEKITKGEKQIALKYLKKKGSYIKNLSAVLLDTRSTTIDKLQYIQLAARRDYFDYVYLEDVTLSRVFATDCDITNNKLLELKKSRIHFKYEER